MKLLALVLGIALFSTANAAKIENVHLSEDMQQCVNSMQLQFSPLTERIAQDLLGGQMWSNPFRTIDRAMMAQGDIKSACMDDYLRFREKALIELNTKGTIKVYGKRTGTEAKDRLGHFVRQPWFFYGGL